MLRLRPFNVLTVVNDRELDKTYAFATSALSAIQGALDHVRTEGNVAQFDRLMVQYREYRSIVLALKPDATVPDAPDFAAPAELRPAA